MENQEAREENNVNNKVCLPRCLDEIVVFERCENIETIKAISSIKKLVDKKILQGSFVEYEKQAFEGMIFRKAVTIGFFKYIGKKNDVLKKYVKEVTIYYSKIDNYKSMLVFVFEFNDCYKVENSGSNTHGDGKRVSEYTLINEMQEFLKNELFRDIESTYSYKYKLPVFLIWKVDYGVKLNAARDSIHIKENNGYKHNINSWLEDDDKGKIVDIIIQTDIKSSFQYIQFVAWLGNKLYYYLFKNIEIKELESKIGCYYNGTKKYVSPNDYYWLIANSRALNYDEIIYENQFHLTPKYIWFQGDMRPFFRRLYRESLNQIETLRGFQNDRIIIWVTVSTLVVATLSCVAFSTWLSIIGKTILQYMNQIGRMTLSEMIHLIIK